MGKSRRRYEMRRDRGCAGAGANAAHPLPLNRMKPFFDCLCDGEHEVGVRGEAAEYKRNRRRYHSDCIELRYRNEQYQDDRTDLDSRRKGDVLGTAYVHQHRPLE